MLNLGTGSVPKWKCMIVLIMSMFWCWLSTFLMLNTRFLFIFDKRKYLWLTLANAFVFNALGNFEKKKKCHQVLAMEAWCCLSLKLFMISSKISYMFGCAVISIYGMFHGFSFSFFYSCCSHISQDLLPSQTCSTYCWTLLHSFKHFIAIPYFIIARLSFNFVCIFIINIFIHHVLCVKDSFIFANIFVSWFQFMIC